MQEKQKVNRDKQAIIRAMNFIDRMTSDCDLTPNINNGNFHIDLIINDSEPITPIAVFGCNTK